MGSMIDRGHPSLGGHYREQKSPCRSFFLHFAAEMSQGCPGEWRSTLSVTVPPESGTGSRVGRSSAEGVKHGTVMTLKVKSGSPGGLPRGTGALTPVLAAPTTGAKVGLRQG